MRVEVLYFAILRERLRRDRETVELPAGTTVGGALAAIGARNPDIAPLLPQVQVAVNRSVTAATQALADGDELALLPPVAGGASPRRIAVLGEALSLDDVIDAVVGSGERGGLVTFSGVVRRQGNHGEVVRLVYEAYIEM